MREEAEAALRTEGPQRGTEWEQGGPGELQLEPRRARASVGRSSGRHTAKRRTVDWAAWAGRTKEGAVAAASCWWRERKVGERQQRAAGTAKEAERRAAEEEPDREREAQAERAAEAEAQWQVRRAEHTGQWRKVWWAADKERAEGEGRPGESMQRRHQAFQAGPGGEAGASSQKAAAVAVVVCHRSPGARARREVSEARHRRERERAARNDQGQAEEQEQLEREGEEGQDEAASRAHHLERPREEGGREGRKEHWWVGGERAEQQVGRRGDARRQRQERRA